LEMRESKKNGSFFSSYNAALVAKLVDRFLEVEGGK